MAEWRPLDPGADRGRIMDLLRRASDYVRMETGRDPDEEFLDDVLGAPSRTDLVTVDGHADGDGPLSGICCACRGFYAPGDWYIGFLLLDPAMRGRGVGKAAADMVKARGGSGIVRIAVIEPNMDGRRFWEREGFRHLKSVPPQASGDLHVKHVLEWRAPRLTCKPEGYQDLSPYLLLADPEAALRFAEGVFGAERLRVFARADGSVEHAEMRVGDTVVMMGGAPGGAPAHLHLYLPDPDAALAAALRAGGELVQEMRESGDGDRRGGVRDPQGTTWWLARQVDA